MQESYSGRLRQPSKLEREITPWVRIPLPAQMSHPAVGVQGQLINPDCSSESLRCTWDTNAKCSLTGKVPDFQSGKAVRTRHFAQTFAIKNIFIIFDKNFIMKEGWKYVLLEYVYITYCQGSEDRNSGIALIHCPEDCSFNNIRSTLINKKHHEGVYEIDIHSVRDVTIEW